MSPTQQELVRQQALHQLEVLGGKTFNTSDDGIVFKGSQIVLPEGSSVAETIDFLVAWKEEKQATFQSQRRYNYRPWDVAYNGYMALKEHFGMVSQRGMWLEPPKLIDVPVSLTEVVQVPWGVFGIPALSRVRFTFGEDLDPELGRIGVISAQGPKADAFAIQGVFNLVQNYIQQHSIYKGKAIDGQVQPNFIDVENLDIRQIVYSAQVQAELDANLFAPMRYTEATRDAGLPLKRAVLLEGPFGVGKTLALKWAGKVAVEAEFPWTFILVRPGRDDIDEAMRTAKLYAPTVVAFEDVDTVTSADQEANRISRMLDLFDGMDAKGKEVMVVLTTNHVDAIHKGMLRPGRLDAIIHIGAPDEGGIQRLVEVNTPNGHLAEEIDWEAVGEAMDGYLPAFVVEAAGRAIRYSLVRNKGEFNGGALTTEDLVRAGKGLRAQFELMNDASTHVAQPELDHALTSAVGRVIEEKLDSRLLSEE